MRTNVLAVLTALVLLAPSTRAQTTAPPSAAIPEEARKHFVIGTTLFKEAKTSDDFVQVEREFKQAADLAPHWPDPRYNLALTKEAAGDFAGSMADLKLYQQFKLPDVEARTVQDKIYALEARETKRVSDDSVRTAEAASQRARAEEQARIAAQPRFEGVWKLSGGTFTITRSASEYLITPSSGNVSSFTINGRQIRFSWDVLGQNITYNCTLSSDSEKMDGTMIDYYIKSRETATSACEGERRK